MNDHDKSELENKLTMAINALKRIARVAANPNVSLSIEYAVALGEALGTALATLSALGVEVDLKEGAK